MKVLLTEDVAHVGSKHDIVEIKDGYALNYLIPQLKALRSDSPEALKILSAKAAGAELQAAESETLKKKLWQLNETTYELKLKANESGKLFASLDRAKLAKHLIKDLNVSQLQPKHLVLSTDPIEELGEYKVDLMVEENKVATLNLNLLAE